VPFGTVFAYLLMVFFLPRFMVSKGWGKGVNLKGPMIAWNLFLSVLSLFMMLGVLPAVQRLFERGLEDGVCEPENYFFANKTATTFWLSLFVFSKFPELIDTVFLILKNPTRPVPFLHWYHHATVLLFCWYAVRNEYHASCIFAAVNAAVHTVMYFYYFQTEIGYKPSYAMLITVIQILQMVAGIVINGAWMYMTFVQGKLCSGIERGNAVILSISCAIMYGSYLYLFGEFFVKRYILRVRDSRPSKKEQ